MKDRDFLVKAHIVAGLFLCALGLAAVGFVLAAHFVTGWPV